MDRPRRNDIRCSQSPVARHDAGRGSLFLRQRVREKYIDMMAMYKLNKLQFHLIDDSGWRLEIKNIPV